MNDWRQVRALKLMRMTRRCAFLLLLCGLPAAHAEIYICTDERGHRELTDTKKKGCKVLDVPGSIAAPAPRRSAAAAAPALAPSHFPRVDSAQQKERDGERRDILAEEMRSEENKLAELRKDYKGGEPERLPNEKNNAKYLERVAAMKENISRSEKNIEALKREMATIK
jgi:hypothetical protein